MFTYFTGREKDRVPFKGRLSIELDFSVLAKDLFLHLENLKKKQEIRGDLPQSEEAPILDSCRH